MKVLSAKVASTDKPKALKRDCIYNTDYVVLEKKGFRHLFTFTVKALTYTDVPALLVHFKNSAPIFWI